MFGSRVGFSESAYPVDLLPFELNERGGRWPPSKISNEREELCMNMGENNAQE